MHLMWLPPPPCTLSLGTGDVLSEAHSTNSYVAAVTSIKLPPPRCSQGFVISILGAWAAATNRFRLTALARLPRQLSLDGDANSSAIPSHPGAVTASLCHSTLTENQHERDLPRGTSESPAPSPIGFIVCGMCFQGQIWRRQFEIGGEYRVVVLWQVRLHYGCV